MMLDSKPGSGCPSSIMIRALSQQLNLLPSLTIMVVSLGKGLEKGSGVESR
jgi:hypothetical protein